MDTPEVEEFRKELRTWLAESLDEATRAVRHNAMTAQGEELARLRAWNARLDDAGYAAISWPAEHGGRGADVLLQAAFAEEMDAAHAPGTVNPIGMGNIAPAIMAYGTDEQKSQLLPRMRRGEDIWCQGFSEPEAGSDLASLRCRAVRDGEHYVVNGQKVWTSLAQSADWCELLVRTDPDVSKHKGITALLVDMRTPGITVRPLVTITGDAEFNEMFFDDVRVPVTNRLGPENEGWRVAMNTLNNERAGVLSLALMVRRKVDEVIELAARTPHPRYGTAAQDPAARTAIARAWLQAHQLQLLADGVIKATAGGRTPGPEASLGKLMWARCEELTCAAASQVLGPDAVSGAWGRARTYVKATSIAGGTRQVNTGIIATQVLGMPRG
jgi:alkylation response protein AidB-like acyl-CoA dehydrogenase